jgi:hypothetical protein
MSGNQYVRLLLCACSQPALPRFVSSSTVSLHAGPISALAVSGNRYEMIPHCAILNLISPWISIVATVAADGIGLWNTVEPSVVVEAPRSSKVRVGSCLVMQC